MTPQSKALLFRDAFITGLNSNQIRTRLLENATLTLDDVIKQARALKIASHDASCFNDPNDNNLVNSVIKAPNRNEQPSEETKQPGFAANRKGGNFGGAQICYFCGSGRHRRDICPARSSRCYKCSVIGHFSRFCNNSRRQHTSAAADTPMGLMRATIPALIDGHPVQTLLDTGSTQNLISEEAVNNSGLNVFPYNGFLKMANPSLGSKVSSQTIFNIMVNDRIYTRVVALVMPNLCAGVILGTPFLSMHSCLSLRYGGSLPKLDICNLAALNITPPRLFEHLHPKVFPVASKSRRYKPDDTKFISQEISRLLADGIIERSQSPWRAQVLVVRSNNGKNRLVVDYSTTINRFTYLDAYPLPNIENLVSEISTYSFFSSLDMKSAYHQVPIHDVDKQYTALEAAGGYITLTD